MMKWIIGNLIKKIKNINILDWDLGFGNWELGILWILLYANYDI